MVTTSILVFLACWNEFLFAISFTSTIASRTAPAVAGLLQRQLAVHSTDRAHRGRGGGHHHPHHHLRAVLPAPDRRWADLRRGQGLAEHPREITVAEITLDNVTKRFPDGALAVDKISLDIADGEFVHPGRAVRLREVDDAQHDRRAGGHHRRRVADRRQGGQQRRAEGPRHRHGVPELRPLPAHDRPGEHGLRAQAGQDAAGDHRREGQRGGADPGPDPAPGPAARPTCPAASGSGSRWAGPSSAIPRSS